MKNEKGKMSTDRKGEKKGYTKKATQERLESLRKGVKWTKGKINGEERSRRQLMAKTDGIKG